MMKVLSYFVIFSLWLGCAEPHKMRKKAKSDGASVSEGSAPAPRRTKANLNPASSAIHTVMASDQALPPSGTQDLEPTSDFSASADPSKFSTVVASQAADPGSALPQQPSGSQPLTILSGPQFISTWEVPPYTQVTLPLVQNGTYNFTVDWGDRNQLEVITNSVATHWYEQAGSYDIKIRGVIQGWSFNNSTSAPLITNISQWGPLSFGDSSAQFYGATNLTITATDAPDISATTNFDSAFANCAALTTVPGLENWDMSRVTSMSYMFKNTASFNQDLSGWNVGRVTDMASMFYGSAFNQDIHLWNVSLVTTMSYMFYNSSFNNGGVELSWGNKTSNLKTINSMFEGATRFNQKVGSWKVMNVTNPSSFGKDSGMTPFTYNDLLIGWNGGSAGGAAVVGGPRQTTLTPPTLNVSTNYTKAAEPARSLMGAKGWRINDNGLIPSFDSTWSTPQQGTTITLPLYSGGTYNFTVDWGDGTQEVITTPPASHKYEKAGDYLVSILGTIKGWSFYEANEGNWNATNSNAPLLKNISQWGPLAFGNPRGGQFWGASNLTITATDKPDLSDTTNLNSAFKGASTFNQDISGWNVSSVKSMDSMFEGATLFNQNLSGWNVSQVTSALNFSSRCALTSDNTPRFSRNP